ncbi:hypothetical protein WJX72_002575 [[Myrmecia] bisecta]|uniref:Uncharacterized protein n=1 Tax=[Myrmecia] bisecta TaxID=41462 RepID=A0AAW1P0D7_9CHLO
MAMPQAALGQPPRWNSWVAKTLWQYGRAEAGHANRSTGTERQAATAPAGHLAGTPRHRNASNTYEAADKHSAATPHSVAA